MNLKKCMNCGALVWILKDCNCDECGIKCCLTEMVNVKANSVDAAIEKHKPVYTIVGDNIEVSVNHVMKITISNGLQWYMAKKYISKTLNRAMSLK